MQRTPLGLTLIEVIVAMLLFSVVALGLAASSAAITRQMSVSALRSRSALIARTRAELAQSIGCGASTAGSETTNGIRSTWTIALGKVDQTLERPTITGSHADQFYSAIPCG